MKKLLFFLIICINIFCDDKKNTVTSTETKDKEVLKLAKIALDWEDYEKIYDLMESGRINDVKYIFSNNKYIDKLKILELAIEFENKEFTKDIIKTLNDREKISALNYFMNMTNKEFTESIFETKFNVNSYSTEDVRLWEYTLNNYWGTDGFLEKLNFFTSKGMDLSSKTYEGETFLTKLLYYADDKTSNYLVKMLENKSLDKLINIKNKDNRSPLEIAFSYDSQVDNKVIKLMIEKGADIKILDSRGRTLLFNAVEKGNKEVVTMLINKGLDINAKDYDSQNVLSQAILSNNVDAVELLIDKGADINYINNDGWAPIHFALYSVDRNDIKILKMLIDNKKIDIAVKDSYGASIYKYIYRDKEIQEMLIKKIFESKNPILKEMVQEMVETGDVDALNYLSKLSYNFDKNTLNELLNYAYKDKSGLSLIFLFEKGASAKIFNEKYEDYIFDLISERDFDNNKTLSRLFDLGIDYNSINYEGRNILTYAIEIENKNTAKMIIGKKLKQDWRDEKGETPLIVAVQNLDYNLVDYLLNNGSDINETDNIKRNALMILMDQENDSIYSELALDYFLGKGINLNHKDDKGMNLLFYAACGNNTNLLKRLVKLGLDPNVLDDFGNKPLFYAQGKENVEFLMSLTKNIDLKGLDGEKLIKNSIAYNNFEVFTLLVQKGVPLKESYIDFSVINMETYNKKIIEFLLKTIKTGYDQEELFIKALYNNDIETMETLIARGYDIYKKNEYGETVLDIANEENLYISKEFLLKKIKSKK